MNREVGRGELVALAGQRAPFRVQAHEHEPALDDRALIECGARSHGIARGARRLCRENCGEGASRHGTPGARNHAATIRPLMIAVADVVKTYEGKRRVTALDGVSFTVAAGEMVAVMGPSGSGKSTLLHLLGGLDQASSGSIRLDGTELTGLGDDALTRVRRDKIGFIFQFFNLLPTLSAFDNVALPMRLQRRSTTEARAITEKFLELVGLGKRGDHLPDELSGGECQRVAIARALVMAPRVLLADEPTGNLDTVTGGEILDLLKRINREIGSTLVMVTHDADAAAACHRILSLKDGKLVSDGR